MAPVAAHPYMSIHPRHLRCGKLRCARKDCKPHLRVGLRCLCGL